MPKDSNLIGLKNFFLITITFILLSCSNVQEQKKPTNLLPKEKMEQIYTDMLLLDVLYRRSPDKFDSYKINPNEHIFNKFGIDSITLLENIDYYNLEFETNKLIYDKVGQNIEKLKSDLDSVFKIKDSLTKLRENQKSINKDSIKFSLQ